MKILPTAISTVACVWLSFANAAPVPASSVSGRLAGESSWTHVDLKFDAGRGFLLLGMKVGGKDALFLLDTGASLTALREDSARRLGLTVKEAGGSVQGVGGHTRRKVAAITGLTAGSMDFGVTEIGVLGLNLLAMKNEWGGQALDGVLGSDLLDRHKLVIDVAGAALHKPPTAELLAPIAAAAGLVAVDFANPGNLPAIRAKVGGNVVPAVLDTGAGGLMLDGVLCKELKLPSYGSEVMLRGVGGSQPSGHAFIARMDLGPAVFTNNGANIANLSAFPPDVRMVVGIDVMSACGMVLDYGARKVYLRAGETAAQDLGVPGPILGSRESIKAKVAACRTVAEAKVTSFTPQGELSNRQGEPFRKVVFRYRIERVLAGEGKPGDELLVPVAVPINESGADDLKARVLAGEFGLVFLENGGRIQDFTGSLMKCSAIRRAQIMGLKTAG